MLAAARQRLLETTPDDARVLDVGGWAKPLPRADTVLDLLPYATRGLYGAEDDTPERFTSASWIQRDICDHTPWPFAADAFDVAVCSHTLEDIRDPVWVCQELSRVARRGYVEVPAAVEELTWGVHGEWVGWTHHHWITEPETAEGGTRGLRFTFKPHLLAAPGRHLARGTTEGLSDEDKVISLWWEGALPAREQVLVGHEEFDPWLAGLLTQYGGPATPATRSRRRRLLGR